MNKLQKKLREMEFENKSKNQYKSSINEKLYFLKLNLSKVEKIPQEIILFETYEDELNYIIKEQNFDVQPIDKKITIYQKIVSEANISEEKKSALTELYFEDILNGRSKPQEDFEDWEFEGDNKIPKPLIKMLESIYLDVIPEKGKEQAKEYYNFAMKNIKYAQTHKESGAALSTAVSSMRFAVDYLVEANYGIKSEDYKTIGDAFFNTAIKLHEQEKAEARHTVGIALEYYEKGNVLIPKDLKENWEKYRWNETKDLRTDWETSQKNLLQLLE